MRTEWIYGEGPGIMVKIRKIRHCFIFLICLLWLTSCSRKAPTFLEPPFENRLHDRFPGKELRFKPPYRLGQGDNFKIDVNRYSEFNGMVEVSTQGFIRLPFTQEKLTVLDLTLDETEKVIAEAVAPYVVREPKVTVTLVRPDSNFYYVLGAVGRMGKYPMGDEYLFVREALIRAGWPTYDAGLKRARLASSKPDKNALRKINLKKILYEGDLTENYQLEPGDIIYVPQTRISIFIGYFTHFLRPFGVIGQYGHGTQEFIDYTDGKAELENVPDEFIRRRRDIDYNYGTVNQRGQMRGY